MVAIVVKNGRGLIVESSVFGGGRVVAIVVNNGGADPILSFSLATGVSPPSLPALCKGVAAVG